MQKMRKKSFHLTTDVSRILGSRCCRTCYHRTRHLESQGTSK